MGRPMELGSLGVQGIPTGRPSGCPCCAGASGIHLNLDFNFGLGHWLRCGTAAPKQPPPNQKLYLCIEDVGSLAEAATTSSAAVQAETDRACSDFNAAEVLGRTSDKVLYLPALHWPVLLVDWAANCSASHAHRLHARPAA